MTRAAQRRDEHPVVRLRIGINVDGTRFDAPCFTRFGRDIFRQPDPVSNDFGAAWLRRHLAPAISKSPREFHERLPTHIDTTLVPVRPGVVLINPYRPCLDQTLNVLHEN
jgi:glycine amidinotransferase